MIIELLLVIFVLVLFVWQISNFVSIFAGSVYVPADTEVISFALKKAGLNKNNTFYDLGSGNGAVLLEAVKFGANCRGVEISPFYYFVSRFRTRKYSKIKIIFGDLQKVNLKNVDCVYCYLLPKFLKKLENKFLSERPKKIISISFPIPHLPLEHRFYYKNKNIYIYSLSSREV